MPGVLLCCLAGLCLMAAEAADFGGLRALSVKDCGAQGNWDWGNRQGADDTVAIQKAVDLAAQLGAPSAVVYFPPGNYCLSATLRLPNGVRLVGDNGRNSQLHAAPQFTGTCMFHAENGGRSMFHSRLENLILRAHDNPQLEALVRADAWQENCGLSRVILTEFTKYGLELRLGAGGAAMLSVQDCEIFAGSRAVAGAAGIYVHQISAAAGFMLRVESTTIAGATAAQPLDYGIFMTNDTLVARVVHFENTRHGVWLERHSNAVLDALTGSPTRTEPSDLVGLSATWDGFLTARGLLPHGFTYTLNDARTNSRTRGNLTEVVLPPNP